MDLEKLMKEKEEFAQWLIKNLQKIEPLESQEGSFIETVNLLGVYFKFGSIRSQPRRKSYSGEKVWRYYFETSDIVDETWFTGKEVSPNNILIDVRLWKRQNETNYISIVVEDTWTKRYSYWRGSGDGFMKEALRKWKTQKTSNKFGL